MTVELRAHHLLCVLTYVGEGYGPSFVRHFDEVAARLSAGEAVTIVEGPDELCRVHIAEAGDDLHCLEDSVRERDGRARRVVAAALGGRLPDRLDADTVAVLRRAFAEGRLEDGCNDCPWRELCLSVAREGFVRTRLKPVSCAQECLR